MACTSLENLWAPGLGHFVFHANCLLSFRNSIHSHSPQICNEHSCWHSTFPDEITPQLCHRNVSQVLRFKLIISDYVHKCLRHIWLCFFPHVRDCLLCNTLSIWAVWLPSPGTRLEHLVYVFGLLQHSHTSIFLKLHMSTVVTSWSMYKTSHFSREFCLLWGSELQHVRLFHDTNPGISGERNSWLEKGQTWRYGSCVLLRLKITCPIFFVEIITTI